MKKAESQEKRKFQLPSTLLFRREIELQCACNLEDCISRLKVYNLHDLGSFKILVYVNQPEINLMIAQFEVKSRKRSLNGQVLGIIRQEEDNTFVAATIGLSPENIFILLPLFLIFLMSLIMGIDNVQWVIYFTAMSIIISGILIVIANQTLVTLSKFIVMVFTASK